MLKPSCRAHESPSRSLQVPRSCVDAICGSPAISLMSGIKCKVVQCEELGASMKSSVIAPASELCCGHGPLCQYLKVVIIAPSTTPPITVYLLPHISRQCPEKLMACYISQAQSWCCVFSLPPRRHWTSARELSRLASQILDDV